MRPLPRVHAITDTVVITHPEFGVRAAAIASSGPAVALHARGRTLSGAALTALAERLLAHAEAPQAAVLVNGRPDIARAVGAHGVQLRQEDMAASEARVVLGTGWIGCSVHNLEHAERAVEDGADFLMVGHIFETSTHPGRPAAGTLLVERTAALGRPVIAIGGITADRAYRVRDAGAYGVAAITALWGQDDSAAAAAALLEPWVGAT
jgi:thiamine-phosphate pyrophosphorylase